MKKKLIILLCFLFVHQAKAQTFNPLLAAKLQFTLDSLVSSFANTKGMSASVYCPGVGIWQGTSGLSHSGQPITSQMLFGIASNAKLFTATLLLKLAERNVLQLDDSLHEWLPSFQYVDSNITIRQLLSHRSGLSDPFFTTALLDSIQSHPTHYYTPIEVLSWLGPPVYSPGVSYNYSNMNYILAGMVAESATGIDVSQLIRDSILNPLQLDSTFYDIEEPIIGTIAHRWNDGIDIHNTSRISLSSAGGPAGAIFSTAIEMVQWYKALMGGEVISQYSIAEMSNFMLPGNYGLGLAKFTFFGRTAWGHGGSTIGYKSRMIYDPCTKAAVCGLSNSSPSAVDGITALLYKVLLDYLPDCAGIITGASNVCQGQNSVSYSVPAIPHATSYQWSLPSGISGSSMSNTITVNVSSIAVSGMITVKGVNAYGVGAESTLAVNVDPSPVVTTSLSSITVCSGQTIVLSANGATNYVWQPGAMVGSSIIVSPLTSTNYTVTGSFQNGCTHIATSSVLTTPCVSSLSVKLYMQSFYAGNQSMRPVLLNEGVSSASLFMVDTISVELRNPFPPYALALSAKTLLYSNGMAYTNFPLSGLYYLVIKHRNGIETWSANPIAILANTNYDFTTSINKAFGLNQIEVESGVWAFYSGDLNSDENIDLLDLGFIEVDINLFQFGYFATDLNGDGNVDLLDLPVLEENVNNFVFSNHP
ncbi:MAG: serine hydrolase [Bacteroidetes bacterium]|nr:serine hydrolase [Bacteroidota bacterium]